MFHSGKAIVAIQKKLGISCSALSQQLAVAPNQVVRWRQSKDIKMSVALKICAIADIKVTEFINMGS